MSLAEEPATVSFVKGGYAYLKTDNASACSSCSAKSSCGSKTFSLSDPEYTLRVKNTLNLKKGDSVVLALESNKLLFGTIIIYILPLLMLFIFAFIAKVLFGEIASIAGGVLGLLGSLLFIRKFIFNSEIVKRFEPTVIYNLDPASDNTDSI